MTSGSAADAAQLRYEGDARAIGLAIDRTMYPLILPSVFDILMPSIGSFMALPAPILLIKIKAIYRQ